MLTGFDDLPGGSERERLAILLTVLPAAQSVRAAGVAAKVAVENFAARGHLSPVVEAALLEMAVSMQTTADDMQASVDALTKV